MTDYKDFENKMKKTCDALTAQLATLRAGRANASVLDQIQVDYYGSPTPIQQVASIATPDPRTLLIQPWDGSVLKGIEKAILASDLGINPQNDGRQIRLVFPPLTEERRKELAKQTKKYAEESKVAIRNVRRDSIEKLKKAWTPNTTRANYVYTWSHTESGADLRSFVTNKIHDRTCSWVIVITF